MTKTQIQIDKRTKYDLANLKVKLGYLNYNDLICEMIKVSKDKIPCCKEPFS
jgi:hypothetical protein